LPDPVRLVRDLGLPIGQPRWPPRTSLAPFTATLAPKAHALMIECYRSGFGTTPADFDTWWAATRHDSEFDSSLCFCVMQDERLVGFEHCWTSAFIKDIVVQPLVRRQGIGEALLRHAFAIFRARGCTEIALKVNAANVAARRLYGRLGFREG
jgi:ribosomal protein S18 acetylase RimI-like enzyme